MALGADRHDVVRLVMREASVLALEPTEALREE
jgi:hypothetical protein